MTSNAETGWLRKDTQAARKEIKTWPKSIRPFLDGSYARSETQKEPT